MEYSSGSVSPESSRMMYITWDVNQGLFFLVVYFKAKLEAIYPKSVKKVINLNGYIASRAWIQNINQIIKLSIV